MDESDSNPISPYYLIFKHKKNTLELDVNSNVSFYLCSQAKTLNIHHFEYFG